MALNRCVPKTLNRSELAFLVLVLLALVGFNVFNIVTSIQRTVRSQDSPGQALYTVERNEFPPMTFGVCRFQDPGFRRGNIRMTASGGVIFDLTQSSEPNLVFPTIAAPENATIVKSISAVPFECLLRDVALPFAKGSSQTMQIDARVNTTKPDTVLFAVKARPVGAPESDWVMILSQGVITNQVSLTFAEHRDTKGRVKATNVAVTLSPFSSDEGVSTAETAYRYILTSILQTDAYTVSVRQDVVTYDYNNCLASIFSWFSLSLAILKFLFPVLPFGPYGRFFVLSAKSAALAAGGAAAASTAAAVGTVKRRKVDSEEAASGDDTAASSDL